MTTGARVWTTGKGGWEVETDDSEAPAGAFDEPARMPVETAAGGVWPACGGGAPLDANARPSWAWSSGRGWPLRSCSAERPLPRVRVMADRLVAGRWRGGERPRWRRRSAQPPWPREWRPQRRPARDAAAVAEAIPNRGAALLRRRLDRCSRGLGVSGRAARSPAVAPTATRAREGRGSGHRNPTGRVSRAPACL